MTEQDVALAARGIGVSFGGTSVLRNVDVDIMAGEIHGLVGENGAGKSTLGKVLGGYYTASTGTLDVFGERVETWGPPEALARGVAIMHQELQLVPALTVAQNVFLGIEEQRSGILRHTENIRLLALMEESGFHLNSEDRAGTLSIADRQKVEILRALARDARVIVMDEPTSSLGRDQIDHLHGTMCNLRDSGRTVIYVSHFLDDILEVTDQITVLRDGDLVQTVETKTQTKVDLVSSMLGSETATTPFPKKYRSAKPAATPLLEVYDLCSPFGVNGVDLTIGAGEIVGLAGLVGAGRTEIARALIGADPSTGTVTLDGTPFEARTPARATDRGLVLVPEDRRKQGLVMTMPARANLTLPHLRRFSQRGILSSRRERTQAEETIKTFQVRPASVDGDISRYSGGNQQKILIGKWLVDGPKAVIFDEPSRGVDVGARQLIHEAIAELAARGVGVLLISSEIEEVLGVAHRACLVDRGRIKQQVMTAEVTPADVLQQLFKFQSDSSLDVFA
ncbi:MAG: sugar ABC transporter ATP-binding protein [Rhodobacteraceae bacterium]|nr:sugar ABC transporter ATP-binding protein [Paracoccaceae bacterium]